ncbi:MAG: TolC family protein [Kiritimatiellia bacterium]
MLPELQGRKRIPLVVIFGALIIGTGSGCRSIKAPESYADMWQPAGDETPVDDYASRSRQGQRLIADFAEPLSLAQLLEIALMHHPALRQAWQQARSSEAVVHQAESDYYPQLNLSGRLAWQRSDDNNLQSELDTTSYGPRAELTWLLLDFGGRSARREQALQQLAAANYDFNRTFQNLVLSVQQAYYNLLGAQAAVESALADAQAAAKTLESARQRQKAGLGVELDVLQAQADYDQAAYMQASADGDLKVARGKLASAIGCPPDVTLQIAPPAVTAPPDLADEDVRAWLNEAMTRRPDLAALRAQVLAGDAAVRDARSARWPALNAGASAERYWNSFRGADLADNSPYTYIGYIGLSWDVFDGLLKLQKQRAAQADREVALYQLQKAELEAGAEVWEKYHGYLTAGRKLAYSESALANAEGAYDLASQAYASGLKNILDLLNAQKNLAQARDNLVQSRKEVWLALAELANVLGTLHLGPGVAPEQTSGSSSHGGVK